jgi:peptide chain release factor 3
MFRYVENGNPVKFKQLAKGLEQLTDEGVAQLFVSVANGRKIIGTVGALQFDVIQYRLEHEYGATCRYEQLPMHKACWIESVNAEKLKDFRLRKYQQLATDKEGREVYMAESPYNLQMARENFPEITFHFTSEF